MDFETLGVGLAVFGRQSLLGNFQYPCGNARDWFDSEQRPVR